MIMNFGGRKTDIDGFEVIELFSEEQTVSIALGIGNTLYHWSWKGNSILWFPYSLDTYQENNKIAGVPLMYPWANRLASFQYNFEGKAYSLNAATLNKDPNGLPLHGLLLKTDRWKSKELNFDNSSAWHTAEYEWNEGDENFDFFPFVHNLEWTHKLDENGVEISLKIINTGDRNIPLSFGFHPYFTYANFQRKDVKIDIPYNQHIVTDKYLIPTGMLEPQENCIPTSEFNLDKLFIDDGFVHKKPLLQPQFKTEDYCVQVEMDAEYKCCVLYTPTDSEKKYLCIEPMVAPTNSLQTPLEGFPVPFVTPLESSSFCFRMNVSI